MKTAQLINELKRLDPAGTAEVEIVIGQYNKVYPIAYTYINDMAYPITRGPHSGSDIIRIATSLPNNMRTSIHKEGK